MKGNKDPFKFNTEIAFIAYDRQQNTSNSNVGDISAAKLKERNKLIKLVDRLQVGWSITQEYEQDPMASDLNGMRHKKMNRPSKDPCHFHVKIVCFMRSVIVESFLPLINSERLLSKPRKNQIIT